MFCKDKKCQKQVSYANWSFHCKKDHADRVPPTDSGNDGNDDAIQPGQRAAGLGDTVSKEPESKDRCQRKNLGTRNAQGAKANDSSNGKIAPSKKTKVAAKKKSQPE